MPENLRVPCSLDFEFGTCDVTKFISIFFNVKKVTQHVIVHVFSFRNVLLHVTSIFNALELINI